MKRLALAALLATSIANASDCTIEYRFHAELQASPRRFDAQLFIDTDARIETRLRLVREWGGVTDFERAIRNVRVEGRRTSIKPGAEPKTWVVSHPAGSRLELRYDVVNDSEDAEAGKPMNHRDFYRNRLDDSHFQLFGHAMLLQPEHFLDSRPLDACVSFSGLPYNWRFASSYPAQRRAGTASIRTTASLQALRSAIYLGGDFRIHRREIAGRPLYVAMRGRWGFEDATFVDATTRVVESHRQFWDDFDFPHFLITLIPNHVERGSTGGTALTNSFAMHASGDFAVPGGAFEFLLVHEHLHTWLPRRLGTMGEQEAQRYWFSEGFTNYLTHRLLLRSGVWKLEDYARTLNEELRQYHVSPARDATNARVRAEFWTNDAVQKIPYRRGELFALHLAGRMAAAGASLDATLRSLRLPQSALPREGDSRDDDLAVNRLRTVLRARLGDSALADLQAYIEEGRPMPIGDDFLGPCFSGKWVEKPLFELGFDAVSFRSRKLAGLVAGSAAERSGLREGMDLAGWSVFHGNVEKEVTIQLMEAGKVRDVKYRPVATTPARMPEFEVKAGAREDAACSKWAYQD